MDEQFSRTSLIYGQEAIEKLNRAIEEYLKQVDKIREDERRNMWTTTKEALVSEGRAEVCASMKAIITEIMAKPAVDGMLYDLTQGIRKRKNEIVDNELSNYLRGRNDGLWHRLLRFEGKCADALENEWLFAFYLGLQCRASLSEEQLNEMRSMEGKVFQALFDGSYDVARHWGLILAKTFGEVDEDADMILRMMPRPNNPHYEQIMDFMSDYVENKDD